MSEQSRVRVVKTEILSDSWARLEAAHFDYLNSGGQWERQVREVYNRGHGAAILLYNLTARSVILIRQFRYPVFTEDGDGFMIEVPAGVIDNGNPEQTVKAETEQETGYRIGSVQSLFKAYVSPGSVTECLHYYCAPYSASDKIGDGGGLDAEGEDIEVMEVDFAVAMSWVESGKINDAKTILLLQHAALHLFGQRSE